MNYIENAAIVSNGQAVPRPLFHYPNEAVIQALRERTEIRQRRLVEDVGTALLDVSRLRTLEADNTQVNDAIQSQLAQHAGNIAALEEFRKTGKIPGHKKYHNIHELLTGVEWMLKRLAFIPIR